MTDDPIADLIGRVAGQDRAAFRDLHNRSAAKLAGVLTRMLRDKAEVEDALQEIFIRVWQRAAQFDGARGQGMSWLIAIARNHALDRLRSRPEARGLRAVTAIGEDGEDPVERLVDGAPSVESRLVARGDMQRVVRCFDELEPERAAAVRGAYLTGLSYKDLAERHGVPLNTIRTWLHRSLTRLKECLER